MTEIKTQIQDCRAFLEEWANSKTNPRFAVMIEGGWGCGKTHFVNSLIEDSEFTQRKVIYLSTFGFADSQALETNLFYASLSGAAKWGHRGAGLMGSILGSSLKIGSGGALDGSVDLDKVVKALTRQIGKSAKSLNKALLILDDLERCEIGMTELLGVINRYVEHSDTRVILVANTERIKEIDGNDFTSLREKVVGHSFSFKSHTDEALASFIEEISECKVRTIIERQSGQIRELHDLSGYHNLRALRQFVWHLQGIVTKLDKQHYENEPLIKELIFQMFVFFIEFKLDLSEGSKSLTPRNLRRTDDSNILDGPDDYFVYEPTISGNEESWTPKVKVLSKYSVPNGIHTVVSVRQWIAILETGLIDQTWLNEEIADSNEVAGPSALPSWQRLSDFQKWDLSDEADKEFQAILDDLNKCLHEGQYQDPEEFLQVTGVLLMLSKSELYNASLPETVQLLKEYVDSDLIPAMTYENHEGNMGRLQHISNDGFEYIMGNDPEFKKVLSHLLKKMEEWYVEWSQKEAGLELVGYLPRNLPRFLENITSVERAAEQLHLKRILYTIEPEKFVDAWLGLPRSDELSFVGRIKGHYKQCSIDLDLEDPWWRNVQQELKTRMDSEPIKLRAVQIRLLANSIDQFIK